MNEVLFALFFSNRMFLLSLFEEINEYQWFGLQSLDYQYFYRVLELLSGQKDARMEHLMFQMIAPADLDTKHAIYDLLAYTFQNSDLGPLQQFTYVRNGK